MDKQFLPFERLHVYHESIEFVDAVYTIVRSWPKEELFGLADQFKRAAVSIALNIAEGSSRSKKIFIIFSICPVDHVMNVLQFTQLRKDVDLSMKNSMII